MANLRRGEITAEIGGETFVLCLTLGALAELEDACGAQDLVALTARFARGRLAARDAIRIVAAGLRGAGESVTEDEVARMTTPGGAAGFARIVGELIAATFGAAGGGAGRAVSPPGAADVVGTDVAGEGGAAADGRPFGPAGR